jgi:hypothetical protein
MPGLMMDFPAPVLKGRGERRNGGKRGGHFAFESSVLQAAFAVKKAYYQLHFVNAKIAVNQDLRAAR